MFSSKTRYALRAVIYLSVNEKNGEKIGIRDISNNLDIPTPFLAKIMQSLARQKVLVSSKGPGGGFALAKPSDKITIMEIIEKTEGKDFFDKCLIGIKSCSEGKVRCPFFKEYNKIRDQLKNLFKEQTMQDLIDDFNLSSEKFKI